jgi:hypothetical protein
MRTNKKPEGNNSPRLRLKSLILQSGATAESQQAQPTETD